MLGAASVLVVHARLWILLVEVFTHWTAGEREKRGTVALKPLSGRNTAHSGVTKNVK